MNLYHVSAMECVVYYGELGCHNFSRDWVGCLYPRYDGDYSIPTTFRTTADQVRPDAGAK